MTGLSVWMTVIMSLIMLSRTSLANFPIEEQDENIVDRQIRAPFNGMRGKRYPSSNEDFNRWFSGKRAPFNGMRGKRMFEDGPDYNSEVTIGSCLIFFMHCVDLNKTIDYCQLSKM